MHVVITICNFYNVFINDFLEIHVKHDTCYKLNSKYSFSGLLFSFKFRRGYTSDFWTKIRIFLAIILFGNNYYGTFQNVTCSIGKGCLYSMLPFNTFQEVL